MRMLGVEEVVEMGCTGLVSASKKNLGPWKSQHTERLFHTQRNKIKRICTSKTGNL